MERKLAAILAADVAGYSRLMGVDEEATVDALHAAREIVDRLIAQHRGRIFNTAGDSIVVEFSSAVDAINAAVEIQRAMARQNEPLPADKRFCFRIGLTIGEVLVEGENLLGDGVNLTARLQALARPGEICVSRNLFNQVRNKVDLDFEDLGVHRVKNIAQGVPVYRVLTDSMRARPLPLRWLMRLRRRRVALSAAAVLLLLAGAAAAIWYGLEQGPPPASKPAIAVLPLDDMGGDDASARLASGITEDIITDLAHFQDLEVIARNSTLVYKGKAVDVRQVGRDLHVGYVLEGSIQRHGEQIRITAQLIDAATGAHLWAERWDRPAEDTFAVQTEVAEHVAGTLGSVTGLDSLAADQIRKLKGRSPASLLAYDYYLLAVEAKGIFTKESRVAGIEDATKAIALDPNFARAYAVRARLTYNTIHDGADYETVMRSMEADARRAVDLDPNDPEARAALAWYYSNRGLIPESEAEIRLALAANPANMSTLIFRHLYPGNGRPSRGSGRAGRQSPADRPARFGGNPEHDQGWLFLRPAFRGHDCSHIPSSR